MLPLILVFDYALGKLSCLETYNKVETIPEVHIYYLCSSLEPEDFKMGVKAAYFITLVHGSLPTISPL